MQNTSTVQYIVWRGWPGGENHKMFVQVCGSGFMGPTTTIIHFLTKICDFSLPFSDFTLEIPFFSTFFKP